MAWKHVFREAGFPIERYWHWFLLLAVLSPYCATTVSEVQAVHPPIYLSIYLSTYLLTYLSTYLPTYLSIYLSIYQSYPSISWLVCLLEDALWRTPVISSLLGCPFSSLTWHELTGGVNHHGDVAGSVRSSWKAAHYLQPGRPRVQQAAKDAEVSRNGGSPQPSFPMRERDFPNGKTKHFMSMEPPIKCPGQLINSQAWWVWFV